MNSKTNKLSFLTCFALLLCSGLLGPCSVSAAKAPPAARPPGSEAAKVLRVLFQADVYSNLGQEKRARELYSKADPSGTCPPGLVSAYMATRGAGEQLYLQMEAARKGDMEALVSALQQLYLNRTDLYADPQLALGLYRQAKKAAPKDSFEDEQDVAELLKLAAAPGNFDPEKFLKTHGPAAGGTAQFGGDDARPYYLWELAEEASVEGKAGRADPELVLQLVARGSKDLSERLSAVRTASEQWSTKRPGRFRAADHVSSNAGVWYVTRRMRLGWELNQKERTAGLLVRARERGCEPLLKNALESAHSLAQEKAKHVHFTHPYSSPEWQAEFFLHWEVEKALRLMDSVFSRVKPVVPTPLAETEEAFHKWQAAAGSQVPPHLQGRKPASRPQRDWRSGRTLGRREGPCLAFLEAADLMQVVSGSEVYAERCAEVFARMNPGLSREEWKSWLLTEILRGFDGSIPALERWNRERSTAGKNAEENAADPKHTLTAIRLGLKAGQSTMFDSMKDAAFAWIERRAALIRKSDGGQSPKDFMEEEQTDWLRDVKPLLAGRIPSRTVPVQLADSFLSVRTTDSERFSAASLKKEKAEAAAWVEYRNQASRFLATFSPALSEEDWKGWLSEKRFWELHENAIPDTLHEEQQLEEGKSLDPKDAEFERLQAIFEDPRSMDMDLVGGHRFLASIDGRLRIASRDVKTEGPGDNYHVIAQFKSPDGQVGHAVLASPNNEENTDVPISGEVQKIETIFNHKRETIYLVWFRAEAPRSRWTHGLAAVTLRNGRIENAPIFKKEKGLVSSIRLHHVSNEVDPADGFRLERTPDSLVIPSMDHGKFSTKHFHRSVFDGNVFEYPGALSGIGTDTLESPRKGSRGKDDGLHPRNAPGVGNIVPDEKTPRTKMDRKKVE